MCIHVAKIAEMGLGCRRTGLSLSKFREASQAKALSVTGVPPDTLF